MGAIERVTCASCGKLWEGKSGCGMMHGRLENVLGLFPQEIVTDIKEATKQQMFPRFHFEYQLTDCTVCKAVVSVPVLELSDAKKIYIGDCPICQSRMVKAAPIEQLQCPNCQKQSLEKNKIAMWD